MHVCVEISPPALTLTPVAHTEEGHRSEIGLPPLGLGPGFGRARVRHRVMVMVAVRFRAAW